MHVIDFSYTFSRVIFKPVTLIIFVIFQGEMYQTGAGTFLYDPAADSQKLRSMLKTPFPPSNPYESLASSKTGEQNAIF